MRAACVPGRREASAYVWSSGSSPVTVLRLRPATSRNYHAPGLAFFLCVCVSECSWFTSRQQAQLSSDAIFVRRASPKLLLSCSDLARYTSSCRGYSPFATARSRSMAGQWLPIMVEVLSKSAQSHHVSSWQASSLWCPPVACSAPHPVTSKAGKTTPTGIRRAFWDGLAPVPAPFTLNGTHQDYTDCSTHRHD